MTWQSYFIVLFLRLSCYALCTDLYQWFDFLSDLEAQVTCTSECWGSPWRCCMTRGHSILKVRAELWLAQELLRVFLQSAQPLLSYQFQSMWLLCDMVFAFSKIGEFCKCCGGWLTQSFASSEIPINIIFFMCELFHVTDIFLSLCWAFWNQTETFFLKPTGHYPTLLFYYL